MNSPNATIDFNFYEQPSTISYFDGILNDLRQDLDAEGADTTFTAPELAYFVARFQQFQQDSLGKEAVAYLRNSNNKHTSSHPARIPSSFFNVETLHKGSPLYVILLAAYSFHSDKDISDWQFDAPEEKDVYFELVSYIRKRLVESGVAEALPLVGFAAEIPMETKNLLYSLVVNMEGKV